MTEVSMANDRETGRPRGFAFVTFAVAAQSQLATEKRYGFDLDRRQLTVGEARLKPKRGRGSGGRS